MRAIQGDPRLGLLVPILVLLGILGFPARAPAALQHSITQWEENQNFTGASVYNTVPFGIAWPSLDGGRDSVVNSV